MMELDAVLLFKTSALIYGFESVDLFINNDLAL
jgi:hypothetical protein